MGLKNEAKILTKRITNPLYFLLSQWSQKNGYLEYFNIIKNSSDPDGYEHVRAM
jgi:hypothetical protein